jgi:hypothetical protein
MGHTIKSGSLEITMDQSPKQCMIPQEHQILVVVIHKLQQSFFKFFYGTSLPTIIEYILKL